MTGAAVDAAATPPGATAAVRATGRRAALAVAIATALAAGCGAPSGPAASGGPSASARAPAARVTGTLSVARGATVPPDAIVTVRVVDAARADAPAEVVAERRFVAAGRPTPIPFELDLDPARATPRARLVVQARIEAGGQLLFVTDRVHPVPSGSGPAQLDIVLRPVPGARP